MDDVAQLRGLAWNEALSSKLVLYVVQGTVVGELGADGASTRQAGNATYWRYGFASPNWQAKLHLGVQISDRAAVNPLCRWCGRYTGLLRTVMGPISGFESAC